MKVTEFTFDPLVLLFFVGSILLIVGVIPFTPAWVGGLLVLSQCHLTFKWRP